jgi:5-bromo-4-chloroindolyl phosphate hydrolysis protein
MRRIRPLQQVIQQFEAFAISLRECQNQNQRVRLLKQMRILIDEIDEPISTDLSHLNSDPNSTPAHGPDPARPWPVCDI